MKFAYMLLVFAPFAGFIIASSVSSSTSGPSALECQLDHFQNGFYEKYGNHNATHHLIPVGRYVTVRCNLGYQLVGDERVECDADGHLRNQATCEDINECSFVSDNDEGTDYSIMSYSEITTLYRINFPCSKPATCVNTHGSFTCHCRNKPIAPCTRFLPCTNLLSPEHGYIVEQSQIHIKFDCKDGYSLRGSELRMCVQGSWDGEQAQCQVTTCQPPPDIISNGWSDVENRTYTYGEEVHYGCVKGFRLVGGNSWRICANNFWTSKTPSCEVIQCPDPGQILNGRALLFSRDIGGEVHFRCESGNFKLLGSPVRVCQPSGKWSGAMTTCNNPATYCPTPVVPFNGMVNVRSSLAPPFKSMVRASFDHGDVITLTCNYGYDLIGSKQRRCTKTGQWNGTQAVCRAAGEYDDIEEVSRRLVETTSLLRDGVQIQRRFTAVSGIDSNQHIYNGSAKAGSVKAGRLATIPLSESEGGDNSGLDVYFVFDVSKSVLLGETHIKAIDFAKAFVNKVGVSSTGVGGTRYGAIAYASTAEVMFQLDGDSIYQVHQGLNAIYNLTVSKHSLGEGTATSQALNMVHTNMIQHTASAPKLKGKRLDADKVLFLLTDGQSNMHGSPEHEATILKDQFDVAIHCIGIGNEVDRTELKQVASEPETEHVFLLQDLSKLDELTSAIAVPAEDYSQCGISRGPKNTDKSVMKADDVWPWQAGLYKHEGRIGTPIFFCGGTLIAPNWIMSAAHCFDPKEDNTNTLLGRDVPENIIVYMGMNTRVKTGVDVPRRAQMREVKRIITHEHYNKSVKPDYDNDIALLELKKPFGLNAYVRTVCLPPTTKYESLLAPGEQNKPFATGWGKNNSKDELSDHLKQIALPIRPSDDEFCRVTEHERYGNLTERMFCAGYSDGRADTCDGDSGGPLVRKWRQPIENASLTITGGNSKELLPWEGQWYQVGIVSWGENCNTFGHYGYYTKLQHFVTWVNKIIS